MRRAFTLIEMLVVVAIIATLVAVAVLSVTEGQRAARLRGATRAVFATVQRARSIAMVTLQPSILTFSTKKIDGEIVSKAEITSAKLLADHSLMSSGGRAPRSIDGYRTVGDSAPENDRMALVRITRKDEPEASAAESENAGHTAEQALFEPMDQELMRGVCIRLVLDSEEIDDPWGEVDEAKRSTISTFSNVDALLGLYKDYRKEKEAQEEKEREARAAKGGETSTVEPIEEERHIQWQSNGRTDPHAVYVYQEGAPWADGWCVKVDMYGATRVVSEEESE